MKEHNYIITKNKELTTGSFVCKSLADKFIKDYKQGVFNIKVGIQKEINDIYDKYKLDYYEDSHKNIFMQISTDEEYNKVDELELKIEKINNEKIGYIKEY